MFSWPNFSLKPFRETPPSTKRPCLSEQRSVAVPTLGSLATATTTSVSTSVDVQSSTSPSMISATCTSSTTVDMTNNIGQCDQSETLSLRDEELGHGASILGEEKPASSSLVVLGGLGRGGFATVLLVQDITTSTLFAMKVVSKAAARRSIDKLRMKREHEVLTKVQPSPFLQRCITAFESDSHAFFVVDYVGGGDLLFHLARVTQEGMLGFGEAACRVLLAEVFLGVEHLHNSGIVHADLKLENIMLTTAGHAKVVDYGLSRRIASSDPVTATGSLIYMAPELLFNQVGGVFTDWWAFGVLAHELLSGRSPWSSLTDKKLIRQEIRGLNIKNRLNMSVGSFDMVTRLLCKDYTARLGTQSSLEIRSSPFFGSAVDWEALLAGTAPAAFIPGSRCVAKEDAQQALVEYLKHTPGEAPSKDMSAQDKAPTWFLGLKHIYEHPKLHPRSQPAKMPSASVLGGSTAKHVGPWAISARKET